MKNPYENLDTNKFWKSGVANIKPGAIFDGLWSPKFKIAQGSKILTVGSCFAQHISKWLQENGYNWIEAEKIPADMSEMDIKANGYGIFSFRTGNVYTPALLKQWLSMAIEDDASIDEIAYQDNRFFDLLRPGIPAHGFTSEEELRQSRKETLRSIKNAIQTADIFIFTMGLTEGWRNSHGVVYPACPGTIKGVYDEKEHHFVNYSYAEIIGDMEWIIHEVKKLNAEMKFLLTVSPVPLTATASNQHVLNATSYSKSILRGVAGELVNRYNHVDYFPSYELISSKATKFNFFEENLRSVRQEGVQYVMKHFNASIRSEPNDPATIKRGHKPKNIDEVCDDVLLEQWAPLSDEVTDSNVCLIGDSHMGLISKALNQLGKKHFGGMIMNGSAWTSNLIHLHPKELFVPLENKLARDRWDVVWPAINAKGSDLWVITNICMQTHRSVNLCLNHLSQRNITTLNSVLFDEYFLEENAKKLSLLKTLISRGIKVLVISDPPTRDLDPEISKRREFWDYYDRQSLKLMHEIGCSTFNAGLYFSGDNFKDEYYSKTIFDDGTVDWYHGSEIYYQDLAKILCNDILN